MTIRQRLTAIAAALLLTALLVGTPIVLITVARLVRPPTFGGLDDLGGLLLRPDDGTLALFLVQIVAWIGWAIVTVAFLVEIAARLRHLPVPRIRPIAGPQALVRGLVATAATLFMTVVSVQPVGIAIAAPIASTPVDAETPAVPSTAAIETPIHTSVTYTVRPGDSLWSIATKHLGAGERYPEIIALNPGKLTRPDFLQIGWTLTLPGQGAPDLAPPGAAGTYVVRKGDNLSKIALTHLGDADRYTEIYDASTAVTQPDGRRLTNPDIIEPGWILNLGRPVTPATVEVTPPIASGHTDPDSMGSDSIEPPPFQDSTAERDLDADEPADGDPAAAQDPVDEADAEPADDTHENETDLPPWTLMGLTGVGSGLAAALFVLLRHRRATQHRWRRPGRTIPTPPTELSAAEKTIITEGVRAETSLHRLDGALRTLVAEQIAAGLPIPDVAAVEQSTDGLVLYLTDPCTLTPRWVGDLSELRWQAVDVDDLTNEATYEPDAPAPYPQLVTIGAADDGANWLFNFEIAGIVTLTGDSARVDDFVRFVIAELAANPWSRDVHVECVGVATSLDDLEPRRVTTHTEPGHALRDVALDTNSTIERLGAHGLAAAHAGRALNVGEDLWDSRILIIDHQQAASAPELIDLVDANSVAGTSIVLHGAGEPVGEVIELTEAGRLRMPSSGLDLTAARLNDIEADNIVRLLAIADQWTDETIPPMTADPGTWQANLDNAGHLLAALTVPRDQPSPADARSLLPEPDEAYVSVSATTTEDLAALAPHVPANVADAVEAADPDLDADLDRWHHDPDTPKLTILGPIKARVGRQGKPVVVAKRRAYYTELLIFLATRVRGATTDEVAEAFGISTNRVRKDISVLREWLGTNPRTGRRHVPEATRTRSAALRGTGAYEVEDLLVDADLFRRLRARGEARGGEAGIQDLRTALDLVAGEPLSLLKNGGRPWLAAGPRLDQHLICAVVDVSHVVTTHALERNDYRAARLAAEKASLAAHDEDVLHPTSRSPEPTHSGGKRAPRHDELLNSA